eukprot:c7341_g1_i1.p1 GENE.c7341_g1_i1~~c7341_g1_i1.p1  ORF type:complete len:125 (+),score=42.11 c7341_g1_i1:25-399(+)
MGITRANLRKKRRSNGETLDQTYPQMQPEALKKRKPHEIDADLPGFGQFYCVPCSRYFVDEPTLLVHSQSKFHKKRLRQLKERPYDHDEALRAAGSGGIDNGPKLNRGKTSSSSSTTKVMNDEE